MPRGLNRSGDFRNGTPITLPHNFGNPVTLPHDFGNDVTWTPTPTQFGNPVDWVVSPAHFGNVIAPSEVSLVASTAASTNGSFAGTVTTNPISSLGADFLVAVVCSYGGTFVVSDSAGNLWTPLGVFFPSNRTTPQIFYCSAPTTSSVATFTATVTGGSEVAIAVAAFSGLQTSSDPYEAGTNKFPNSTNPDAPVSAGAMTPASVGDLLIGGFGGILINQPVTINSGFSIPDTGGFGSFAVAALAWMTSGSTSPVNPTWTPTAPHDGFDAATCAAFAKA